MIVTIMNCSFSVFDVDRRIQWNTLWFLQWWACNFEMTVHFLISILHNIPLYAARMCTDVWDLVYAANFQYYWAFPFKFTKKSVCLQEGVKWSGLLLLLLVHPIAFCCFACTSKEKQLKDWDVRMLLDKDSDPEMSTGNSLSGFIAPSPSPWGQISPVPVPVKAHGEHFFPIPVPTRGFNPRGDPHPRIKPSTAHSSSMHMCWVLNAHGSSIHQLCIIFTHIIYATSSRSVHQTN